MIVAVPVLPQAELSAGARGELKVAKGTWMAVVERLVYYHVILASLVGSDAGLG